MWVSIEGRTGLILPRLGNSSVFGDNAATRVILVPPADVMRYKADRDWSRYAGSIEVNP